MRFRKSIQIFKGLRINFSKSGVSATVGGRGVSVNMGPKGTYLNTSIPGTGLYDRKKLSDGFGIYPKTSSSQSPLVANFTLTAGANGGIDVWNVNGGLVTDEATLRAIKRTDEFAGLKAQLMQQLKDEIEKETNEFINIYKLSADVAAQAEYEVALASLTPGCHEKAPFAEPPPQQDAVRAQLQMEARQKPEEILFWKIDEYVNTQLPERYAEACRNWEARKAAYEQSQTVLGEQAAATAQKEYEQNKQTLENAIKGNPEYIEQEIGRWVSSVELPVEFSIQFEYNPAAGCVMLDLDLPEIESVPAEKATQLAGGQVKRTAKTQKEIKQDYMHCVYGLPVFFASHIFNISPAIKTVVASGYTQRRNPKTGDIQDEYIYSIKFVRPLFEEAYFKTIDILKFWDRFENRCLPTANYDLKPIVPYT